MAAPTAAISPLTTMAACIAVRNVPSSAAPSVPVGDASWTLSEINRVLFLRHLYRSGRLAEASQVPQASAA